MSGQALCLRLQPIFGGGAAERGQDLLRGLGGWLKLNGEAIYGTRPWTTYGEGPTGIPKAFNEEAQSDYTAEDIRFTTKDNVLYAILLGWPGATATVASLMAGGPLPADRIESVGMVGVDGDLTWSQDALGLNVHLPQATPCDHAQVLRITLKA